MLIFVIFIIFLMFSFVVFFGAPYVPTLSPQVEAALDMISLKKGETLLELGCGDGKVMIAAAERGIKVIGYELNPILAIICWARTRKYKGNVKVVWGNFWKKKLPPTDAIFVFLLDKYMIKLDKMIIQTYSRQKVKLVSFAFKIPKKKILKESKGLLLYNYEV